MINNENIDKLYPLISDELITRLKEDFPNILPKKQITDYELGFLIGQQSVIDKLLLEKAFNERNTDNV